MEYTNTLPKKYEDIILPLLTLNKKLVLAGSLSLYLMKIMEYDFTNRTPDIDITLKEPLTLEELETIINFFNLNIKINSNIDYNIQVIETDDSNVESIQTIIKPVSHFLNKELIQLQKLNENGEVEYIVDIFNKNYIKSRDTIKIKYNEFDLFVSYPSEVLSHKCKYAYDVRVGKQYKHFEDIHKRINWDNYFKILSQLDYAHESDEDGHRIKYYYFKKPSS